MRIPRNLVVERLFRLCLGRVERHAGRTLDIGNRNRLLRAGLMHGNGRRPTLAVGEILRLREYWRRYPRRRRTWTWASRRENSRWSPRGRQTDNRLAVVGRSHSLP